MTIGTQLWRHQVARRANFRPFTDAREKTRKARPLCRSAAGAARPIPPSEHRAELPELGKKHDFQLLAKITHAGCTAGAGLEPDDPLDSGHVPEAPLAEIVL